MLCVCFFLYSKLLKKRQKIIISEILEIYGKREIKGEDVIIKMKTNAIMGMMLGRVKMMSGENVWGKKN